MIPTATRQRLLALHREILHQRHIGPEHLTKRFADFITAADRMASRGVGSISEFWQGEEAVISDLILFGRGFCGTYLSWCKPESDATVSMELTLSGTPSKFLTITNSKNMSYLDLLRVEEPYKVRRSSSVIRTHRLMMGQRRATWIPYAAYHTLRSRAKWYICYEAVPEWIKTTMVRYHALRYAGKRWVNKVRRY